MKLALRNGGGCNKSFMQERLLQVIITVRKGKWDRNWI